MRGSSLPRAATLVPQFSHLRPLHSEDRLHLNWCRRDTAVLLREKARWYQKEGIDLNPSRARARHADAESRRRANPVGLATWAACSSKGKAPTQPVFTVYANSRKACTAEDPAIRGQGLPRRRSASGRRGARTMCRRWRRRRHHPKSVTWVNIDAKPSSLR